MRLSLLLPLLLTLITTAQTTPPSKNTTTTHLIAPALVTTPSNTTTIQCWNLTTPFILSTTPGTSNTLVATLFNATPLSYTILPPRFNGGIHNAPAPQLVHFVSGLAHVTTVVPQDNSSSSSMMDVMEDLWLPGGKGGLLFAVDTVGRGHRTVYPSDEETVAITAVFEGGRVPEHEVLRGSGGCEGVQTFV